MLYSGSVIRQRDPAMGNLLDVECVSEKLQKSNPTPSQTGVWEASRIYSGNPKRHKPVLICYNKLKLNAMQFVIVSWQC